MKSNDKNTDYDELAEWAEHDMSCRQTRPGPGRPSLPQDPGISGASLKRQVRLPLPLSNKLDELTQRQHRTPSESMHGPVEESSQKHSA